MPDGVVTLQQHILYFLPATLHFAQSVVSLLLFFCLPHPTRQPALLGLYGLVHAHACQSHTRGRGEVALVHAKGQPAVKALLTAL